ncbi:MAG: ABC transporter ATP-binding protein, partial [Nitrospinota bacterium]|nr:ABC transporter ATP-binding protein [Nitrospinota bacterium]
RTLVNRLIIFDRNKISVYEGTYQDFLDNIGWEDDEAPKEREKRKNNLSKKEVRKLKANILNEKTNVLTPFKNEIKKTEKLIENLEKKLNGNNKKLIEASEQGDGSTISDLSKKNHQLESELEELYKNLDKLICSHEGKSKKFEEKLEEL